MQERRSEQRGRTYLGGRVAFNNRWSTVNCLIRNMSAHGAMIEFSDPVVLPGDFELTLYPKGSSLSARVVWRDATTAGIEFLDSKPATTAMPIAAARQIRNLKTERNKLARRVRDLSEPAI